MGPEELLHEHLPLIDQIIGRVCRRSRLYGAEAEDFASSVRLALIENDYALLQTAAQRSSMAAWLTVVIQRMAVDERVRTYGRWHASAEARRLGDVGVLAETLLLRDRRTLDEALPLVRAVDPTVTRERLADIAARLPDRTGRPRAVTLEESDVDAFATPEEADSETVTRELRGLAGRASHVMRETLDSLPLEDRMLLRFRFGSSMTIADISRILRLPQRPLYRRLETLLARLRGVLATAGVDAGSVSELIGSATAEMHFGLANGKNDPAHLSSMEEQP